MTNRKVRVGVTLPALGFRLALAPGSMEKQLLEDAGWHKHIDADNRVARWCASLVWHVMVDPDYIDPDYIDPDYIDTPTARLAACLPHVDALKVAYGLGGSLAMRHLADVIMQAVPPIDATP